VRKVRFVIIDKEEIVNDSHRGHLETVQNSKCRKEQKRTPVRTCTKGGIRWLSGVSKTLNCKTRIN
jgi:hypothetical protein